MTAGPSANGPVRRQQPFGLRTSFTFLVLAVVIELASRATLAHNTIVATGATIVYWALILYAFLLLSHNIILLWNRWKRARAARR